jgi:hypothetical protein
MTDYISREAAIALAKDIVVPTKDGCDYRHRCIDPQDITELPAADVVEVVRCRDCKHRIVNEHFGEKGYMRLKAKCELDTGDPFELGRNAEDDDWFCADGERKDGGQDDG